MTQATLQACQANGTWNASHGVMYSFEVQMSDGTSGECNSKSEQPPYSVGDTVWYEITGQTPRGANKLKVSARPPFNPQQGAQGGAVNRPKSRQDDIAKQWAINAGIQLLIATKGEFTRDDVALEAKALLEMRDSL